jgi:hypothetical protein
LFSDMTGAELCLRAAAGEEIPTIVLLTWLRNCGRSGQRDFAAALGLVRTELVRARDGALLEAALVLGSDDCSQWELAGRMAEAVARFESRLWPRLRAGGSAAGLSPVDGALHRAFLAGVGMIRNRGKLYRLLMLSK